MSFNLRTRAIAALVHAGGSILVAAAAAALVFLLWYPWPYSILAGGTGLFVLVASVDVIIGPVITFAIFDRAKAWPVLRRDLAVILLLQLAALGYGLHVVFEARPVALALETDRFRVVRAVEVALEELPQAPASLRTLPVSGPVLLRTEAPTDSDEKIAAIVSALSGTDLGMRPKFWRPWDDTARRQSLAAGRSIESLRVRPSTDRAALDAAIARTGRRAEELRYLPLLSHYGEWVAFVDATSGDVAGFGAFVGD